MTGVAQRGGAATQGDLSFRAKRGISLCDESKNAARFFAEFTLSTAEGLRMTRS